MTTQCGKVLAVDEQNPRGLYGAVDVDRDVLVIGQPPYWRRAVWLECLELGVAKLPLVSRTRRSGSATREAIASHRVDQSKIAYLRRFPSASVRLPRRSPAPLSTNEGIAQILAEAAHKGDMCITRCGRIAPESSCDLPQWRSWDFCSHARTRFGVNGASSGRRVPTECRRDRTAGSPAARTVRRCVRVA